MKIEIDEVEIKTAIIEYVISQGLTLDPTKAIVDIKNARGDFGVSAAISMDPVFVEDKNNVADIIAPTAEKQDAEKSEEPSDGKKLTFGNK